MMVCAVLPFNRLGRAYVWVRLSGDNSLRSSPGSWHDARAGRGLVPAISIIGVPCLP